MRAGVLSLEDFGVVQDLAVEDAILQLALLKELSCTLSWRAAAVHNCFAAPERAKTPLGHKPLCTNSTCTRRKRKFPACVVARLQTARGGSITAALVEYQAPAAPAAGFGPAVNAPFAAAARRLTILLSHGTAVDLGRVLLYYRCASSAVCAGHAY